MKNYQISMEQRGRRVYFRGHAYPVKEEIKALGGKWDAVERSWWVSTTKFRENESEIQSIVDRSAQGFATSKQISYLRQLCDKLGKPLITEDLSFTLSFTQASERITELKREWKTVQDQKRSLENNRPKPPARPTTKQINYALDLLAFVGPQGFYDLTGGMFSHGYVPSRSDLEKMSKSEVSRLISDLKDDR